jgi:nicotinic acid phosphoribosyltransferase
VIIISSDECINEKIIQHVLNSGTVVILFGDGGYLIEADDKILLIENKNRLKQSLKCTIRNTESFVDH